MAQRPLEGLVETRDSIVGFCFASAPRLDIAALVATDDGDRWSEPGDLALYLALDASVASAEWARHLDPEVDIGIWRIRLGPIRAVDLRRADVRAALDLPAERAWVLDRAVARAAAIDARRQTGACAIVVPSVAFLDRPTTGSAVVTLGSVGEFEAAIKESELVARWVWTSSLEATDVRA